MIPLNPRVERILSFLATAANGYNNHLKWNEIDMLKSDLMVKKEKWTGTDPDAVKQRCIELGMRLEDASQIHDYVTRAMAGRRLVVRSSYRGSSFRD